MISRRHVFFLAGYDPIDLRSQHSRFRREAAKFEKTWGIAANVSEMEMAGSDERWSLTTRGPGWTTSTIFEPLDWHDIVAADLERPALPRLVHGFIAFFDFVLSGTAARYFMASWRYGLFFVMPFFNLLMFAAIGIGAGVAVSHLAGMGGLASAVIALAIAVIIFAALVRWPGRKWRTDQALADWIFARDFMYGRRGDVEQRLDGFARRIAAAAQANDADEILVVGHSLGATMAVEVVVRALEQDRLLAAHGRRFRFLRSVRPSPRSRCIPRAGNCAQGWRGLPGRRKFSGRNIRRGAIRSAFINTTRWRCVLLRPMKRGESPGAPRRHEGYAVAGDVQAPQVQPHALALSIRDGERAPRVIRLFHAARRPRAIHVCIGTACRHARCVWRGRQLSRTR